MPKPCDEFFQSETLRFSETIESAYACGNADSNPVSTLWTWCRRP